MTVRAETARPSGRLAGDSRWAKAVLSPQKPASAVGQVLICQHHNFASKQACLIMHIQIAGSKVPNGQHKARRRMLDLTELDVGRSHTSSPQAFSPDNWHIGHRRPSADWIVDDAEAITADSPAPASADRQLRQV